MFALRIQKHFLSFNYLVKIRPSKVVEIVGDDRKCWNSLKRKFFFSHYKLNDSSPYTKISNIEEFQKLSVKQIMDFDFKNETKKPTALEIISHCETFEDILVLIKDFEEKKLLSTEDLPQYFQLLLKRCKGRFESEEEKFKVICNNPNFHILLKKSIYSAEHLSSTTIAKLFFYFVKFNIPYDSNVMKILVKNIQNRINDFFPKDISICLRVLSNQQDIDMLLLKEALYMHLLNSSVDEKFFHHCLLDMSLRHVIYLLNHSKALPYDVRHQITRACKEIIMKNGHELSFHEAFILLTALGSSKLKHPFLIKTSVKRLLSNPEMLEKRKLQIYDAINSLELIDAGEEESDKLNYGPVKLLLEA